jgi:PLP dependent protein
MIKDNLTQVRDNIPEGVKLVAVSKNNPVESVLEAYSVGQKVFGENRVQELLPKHEALPKDIEWHLIGHLQRNKVKFIASFVSVIHSIDSFKLLKEVNSEAKRNNRVIDVLLQFHVAQEETKYGLSLEDAVAILEDPSFQEMKNIRVIGIMGMASFVEDENQIRQEFKKLKLIFDKMKMNYFPTVSSFKELSMGMSSDYQLAIEEGSTIVRVGSKIFQ